MATTPIRSFGITGDPEAGYPSVLSRVEVRGGVNWVVLTVDDTEVSMPLDTFGQVNEGVTRLAETGDSILVYS